MPYDRWEMSESAADTLTGSSGLTEAQLDAAEAEIVSELGWRPDPDDYGDGDPAATNHDVRVWLFGRAVAWQAAHRNANAATSSQGGGGISSESIGGNYSYEVADGAVAPADRRLAPRARALLSKGGWFSPAIAGRSRTSPMP